MTRLRLRRATVAVAAIVYFAGLAVLFTWPLAAHMSTAVPGAGPEDNLTFVWNLWWMRYAPMAGDSFFHTTYLFHPIGASLVIDTHTALAAWLGATVLGRLDLVAATNTLVLLNLTGNGLAAALVVRDATGRRASAWLAGSLFACSSFFSAHLAGHFNLLAAWGLPLFAWLSIRAFRTRSLVIALAAGAVLGLQAYVDYYYLVFCAAFLVCLIATRWLVVAWPPRHVRAVSSVDWMLGALAVGLVTFAMAVSLTGGWTMVVDGVRISATTGHNVRTALWLALLPLLWRRIGLARPRLSLTTWSIAGRDVRVIVAAGIAALAVAGPILWAASTLWIGGGYATHKYLWRSAPQGIDVLTLLLGNPSHAIWGDHVQRLDGALGIDAIEGTAWLGVLPMALVAVRWRDWWFHPQGRLWAAIGAVFLGWSLGPELRVAGLHSGLYLPEVLIRYVPIVANARMPGRAMVMVHLAMAVLVGLTWRIERRTWRRATALAAACIVECLPIHTSLYALDRPPIYASLASLPSGTVLEVPLGIRDGFGMRGRFDSRSLYYQSIHQQPLVGGFVARLSPAIERRYLDSPFLSALLTLSTGAQVGSADLQRAHADGLGRLYGDGIRYVVLNTRTSSVEVTAFVESLPVRRVASDDVYRLYAVDDREP